MKLNKIAQCIALMGIAGYAFGQTAPEQKLQRVEVTGSSIKRAQDEGASPIQTFKAEDLVKLGITNAEQLLQSISANGNGLDGLLTNQGGDFLSSTSNGNPHNNGASGASLRGLGAQYTLVLMNGRRMSTHGLNGQSVDLNSIPLAAIDRVEILKDGASAIYGADAIGGVINFILKKDFTGFEATAFTDRTQHGGGNINRLSLIAGNGDLAKDGFNIMASLTMDNNDRLRATQRDFNDGYQPERGLAMDTTGTPYANIAQAAGTALPSSFKLPGDVSNQNRANLLAFQGKCETIPGMLPYRGDITGFGNANHACAYDYGRDWSMMQPVQRTNFVSKGTLAINGNTNLTAELVASRTKSSTEYTPIQLTTAAYQYPASGPYYQNLATLLPTYFKPTNTDPADTRVFFDATKPLRIRWRCVECGPRQQDTTTDAMRALVGLDGVFAGWDYKMALSSATSKATTIYGDGIMYIDKLSAAMLSGKVNPFLAPGQTQTAEATALIEGAKAKGDSLYGGTASVMQFDGTFSRELMMLPAGPLAMAVGYDVRNEKYNFRNNTGGQNPVTGVGSSPTLNEAKRDITAVFGEVQIPVIQDLELTLAVRHDQYSDFGSTTNPKAAIRWQPAKEVLLRGTYSTGFHAPDFEPLYGGGSEGQFNSDINDPITCPGGVGVGGNTDGCGIRPAINTSSNSSLKPEKSKQISLGIVLSPTPWITASVDFWQIDLTDRISTLSAQALIGNYDKYKQYVIRDANGQIDSVQSPFLNLAGDTARGIDVSVSTNFKTEMGQWVAGLDGSYLDSYKSRYSESDPWTERVGKFGDASFGWDLKPKWKHTARITWSQGNWSATGSQSYVAGYDAEVDGFGSGVTPPGAQSKVDSYTLYNLSATYTGFKNMRITGGIKNLLDTAPPFSGHNVDNVSGAGWDARVGDPRGRAFTLNVNYKF
ncbi:MAG: TonB-dependent receptor [Rhodoferax sp.]|nr:TonB-dependent receptor [Rhodoferax sp.]